MSWQKGKSLPLEHRRALSRVNTGKRHTAQSCAKMSRVRLALLGFVWTPELIETARQCIRRNDPVEHIAARMGVTKKCLRNMAAREGLGWPINQGRRRSDQAREHMREGHRNTAFDREEHMRKLRDGRFIRWTPDMRAALYDGLGNGMPLEQVARRVGVAASTARYYLQRRDDLVGRAEPPA